MSSVIETAIAMLSDKMSDGFDGVAKFVIEGEGALVIDGSGVRAAPEEEEADVALMADADTFQEILAGDLNPTAAFMGGRLKVDGDMGMAMKLGSALG
ncbi:MAG: SCP2 sterol-binding domain-containing protein [Pseudomonadota bacterium]